MGKVRKVVRGPQPALPKVRGRGASSRRNTAAIADQAALQAKAQAELSERIASQLRKVVSVRLEPETIRRLDAAARRRVDKERPWARTLNRTDMIEQAVRAWLDLDERAVRK